MKEREYATGDDYSNYSWMLDVSQMDWTLLSSLAFVFCETQTGAGVRSQVNDSAEVAGIYWL